MRHKVKWLDSGREPQVAPNPSYPDGIDIDICKGGEGGCKIALPYPARRCGAYHVECKLCGATATVTTAGRKDDPRSLTMPCKPTQH